MISILIPVYNQNVCQLVDDLLLQISETKEKIEIRVYDDGSEESFKKSNRKLNSTLHVVYKEFTVNTGRSAIRNLLAKESKNADYLLYLDGDSKIIHKTFLKTYLDSRTTEGVIYGGRVYQRNKPDKKKILHWKYGIKKESRNAEFRKKDPYLYFQSNNFLVPGSVFVNNLFDENLKTYGYEDLALSEEFKQNGVQVIHIDNEILHDGLEDNEVFITKTGKAINNLAKLYNSGRINGSLLIHTSNKLHRLRLSGMLYLLLKILRNNLVKNLLSEDPSIFIFQLYKLLLWWEETKKASV
jgi:hypothetical protein